MFFTSFPTAFCLPNWGPISGSSDSDVRCRSRRKGRMVPTLPQDTCAAPGSSLKEPGMPPTPAIAWPEIKKDTSFLHTYIKQATWGAAEAAVTLHTTTFSTSCPITRWEQPVPLTPTPHLVQRELTMNLFLLESCKSLFLYIPMLFNYVIVPWQLSFTSSSLCQAHIWPVPLNLHTGSGLAAQITPVALCDTSQCCYLSFTRPVGEEIRIGELQIRADCPTCWMLFVTTATQSHYLLTSAWMQAQVTKRNNTWPSGQRQTQ